MRFSSQGSGAKLVEVEFWPDGQWPTDGIIWPETVLNVVPDSPSADDSQR